MADMVVGENKPDVVTDSERRTMRVARKFHRDLFSIPKDRFFLITDPDYKGCFDQIENEHAYLDIISADSEVMFDNDLMIVDGEVLAQVKYIDHITGEVVESIDKQMAMALYTIVAMKLQNDLDTICPPGYSNSLDFRADLPEDIQNADEETLFEWYHKDLFNYTVVVYMPEFMRYLGYGHPSKEQIEAVKSRIWSLTRVKGVMRSDGSVRPGDGDYLMMDPGFDLGSNVFFIHSPYINKVVERVIRHRIPRMLTLKNGSTKPMLDSKGEPIYYPGFTTIVHSGIASAKNKRAVEVVFAFAHLIVVTGKNGDPNITYSELIGRCNELSSTLIGSEAKSLHDSRYRNQVLRRTFSNVWEYLKKYTSIPENYTYKEYIPKETDDRYVFRFFHKSV